MDEDKNLKELLAKWAVIDAPADFTMQVMQRVESAYAIKPAATPILKHKPMKVLVSVFTLVCIILLALSIVAQPIEIPVILKMEIPDYFSQITSFLIIFWMVMFINGLINKYKMQAV